jgi:enoyl-CoA hydratase/carnithine racemase
MPGSIKRYQDHGVVFVTLDNVGKRNALDVGMWQALKLAFQDIAEDVSVRCVVIEGAGREAFSAGADISEFETERRTLDQVIRFHEQYVGGCLAAIAGCAVPVVAKIRGACIGGGLEIASVCDIRLADETAQLGAPVGRLGFPLAFAETQALFSLAGAATLAEILMEGRVFSAPDAFERRLLTRICAADRLDDEVRECTRNIKKSGAAAAKSHKLQLRRLIADPSPVSLTERMGVYAFAETDEYRRGIRNFLSGSRARGPKGDVAARDK